MSTFSISSQVYISSLARELPAFTALDSGAHWLLTPGAVQEAVCGQEHNSLHFSGAGCDVVVVWVCRRVYGCAFGVVWVCCDCVINVVWAFGCSCMGVCVVVFV